MRVLYLMSPATDYLADSLFHGLRSLLGDQIVDYPRHDLMYRNCPEAVTRGIHGRGFTLYRLLEDIAVDRTQIGPKLQSGYFDLVIISNIWMGFGVFLNWWPELKMSQTVVIDGADSPQLYPYAGKWWRSRRRRFVPRVLGHFKYFKREWTPATIRSRYYNLLPEKISAWLPPPRNLRPISFSIPVEKIVSTLPKKTKKLALHMVDPEAAARFGGSTQGLFTTEAEYYDDLRQSAYSVTTKRAGWDCLRHYEIAANGCVPCFRELQNKPQTCAPHGLNSENCIIYKDVNDLQRQISSIKETEYLQLQANALAWIKNNTTVAAARRFLDFPGLSQ